MLPQPKESHIHIKQNKYHDIPAPVLSPSTHAKSMQRLKKMEDGFVDNTTNDKYLKHSDF